MREGQCLVGEREVYQKRAFLLHIVSSFTPSLEVRQVAGRVRLLARRARLLWRWGNPSGGSRRLDSAAPSGGDGVQIERYGALQLGSHARPRDHEVSLRTR